MIPVYTAQAVLSEIRSRCFPRSVMSHTVANGWENVSSNAFNAALNLHSLIPLAYHILSIEALFVIQAISYRLSMDSTLTLGEGSQTAFDYFIHELGLAGHTLPLREDTFLRDLIVEINSLVQSDQLLLSMTDMDELLDHEGLLKEYYQSTSESVRSLIESNISAT